MRLGLPCGGTLEVVIEPVKPEQVNLYQALSASVDKRELVQRKVNLHTGETSLTPVERFTQLSVQDNFLLHTYGPTFQLLLIGAVQVAWYLSEMAQALDYAVEICDPREELIDSFSASNVMLVNSMPDDWLREKIIDQRTAVIALCHDPRIDDMALMEVLHRDAFYIGAMGSARTSAKRRERLQQLDIPEKDLKRLHAPVGLDIGSKTPPEIAIAILAELTRLRAGLRDRD
jgi:xanthine dehydrogenase accessory factor